MPRRRLPPSGALAAIIPAAGPVLVRPPEHAGPDWLQLQRSLWVQSARPPVRFVKLVPSGPDAAQSPDDLEVRLHPRSLDLVVGGAPTGSIADPAEVRVFLDDLRDELAERLSQLCHAAGGPLLDRAPRTAVNRLDWPSASRGRQSDGRRRQRFRAGSQALETFLRREEETRSGADAEAIAGAEALLKRIAGLLAGRSLPSGLCLWQEQDVAPSGAPHRLRLGARLVGDLGLLADPDRLACVATGLAVVPPLPNQPPRIPEVFALRLCLLIARAADICSPDLQGCLEVRLSLVEPRGVSQALLEIEPEASGYGVTLAAQRLGEQAQVALPEGCTFSCVWLRQHDGSAGS